MFKFTIAAALLAVSVSASHTMTIVNKCTHGVPIFIDSWPGSVTYTGNQPGTLAAGSTHDITIPVGWNSRVCHNADGAKCWGVDSMAEFNYDSGGMVYYDISNIEGYSIAQKIATSCGSVTCESVSCACNEAYPPGSETGCGATVDAPVRACGTQAVTLTYCPAA